MYDSPHLALPPKVDYEKCCSKVPLHSGRNLEFKLCHSLTRFGSV
jgi:hypothetical protein